jgi:hypothetical protein
MERMLADISRTHFPNPPATRVEIEAFERRVGWRLDPELRAFYQHSNGAELFRRPNSPCRLRPLSRVQRARLDMRGEDSDEWGPATWYVIADLPESDCIIIDVGAPVSGCYPVIDGFHEAELILEECKQIAASFSEFLEQLLRHHGRKFW